MRAMSISVAAHVQKLNSARKIERNCSTTLPAVIAAKVRWIEPSTWMSGATDCVLDVAAATGRLEVWIKNMLHLIDVLASEAHLDGTVAGRWDRLMERTGVSRATLARHLRDLRELELLTTIETGRINEHGQGRCAIYGLSAAPTGETMNAESSGNGELETGLPGRESAGAVDGSETPNGTSYGSPKNRARETAIHAKNLHRSGLATPGWTRSVPITSKGRTRRAIYELQTLAPDAFATANPVQLRHELAPWFEAGATLTDLLWMLDHKPDGTPWTFTTSVQNWRGWLRHRLSPWTGHLPPSVTKRQAHAADLTHLAQAREAHQAARFSATPASAVAAYMQARRALNGGSRSINGNGE